jgi:hypothetical protein
MPLGSPSGAGYGPFGGNGFLTPDDYKSSVVPATNGINEFHPGEDWNDADNHADFGNDSNDAGDPVSAIGRGIVKFAGYVSESWGWVVLIEHRAPVGSQFTLPDGTTIATVWSQYGHMASITNNPRTMNSWAECDIVEGAEQIGTVGDYPNGSDKAYHLHFEVRTQYRNASAFVLNVRRDPDGTPQPWPIDTVRQFYASPSEFVLLNPTVGPPPIPAPVPLLSNLPNTGAGVAAGITDSSWKLLGGPTCPGGNCPVYATVADGFPINSYWPANDSTSKWIEPVSGSTDDHLGGQYTFRLVFTVPPSIAANAIIQGRWATDDLGVDILINGVSRGFSTTTAFQFSSFFIQNGFVGGTNTVDFVVNNRTCSSCINPVGLRVELVGGAIAGSSPPVAVDDVFTTNQGGTLTILTPGVLGNDTVPVGSNPIVEFLPPFPPAALTDTGGGGFILDFGSNPSFVGSTTLKYVIHSSVGDSNVATAAVNVTTVTLPTPHFKMSANNSTAQDGQQLTAQADATGAATVTFADASQTSTDPIVDWSWTIAGIGVVSIDPEFSYSLPVGAAKTVTLTLSTQSGAHAQAAGTIYVVAPPLSLTASQIFSVDQRSRLGELHATKNGNLVICADSWSADPYSVDPQTGLLAEFFGSRLYWLDAGGTVLNVSPSANSFWGSELPCFGYSGGYISVVESNDRAYLIQPNTIFASDRNQPPPSGWPRPYDTTNSGVFIDLSPYRAARLAISDDTDSAVFVNGRRDGWHEVTGFDASGAEIFRTGAPVERGCGDMGITRGPGGDIYTNRPVECDDDSMTLVRINRSTGQVQCVGKGPFAFETMMGNAVGVFTSSRSGLIAFDGDCASRMFLPTPSTTWLDLVGLTNDDVVTERFVEDSHGVFVNDGLISFDMAGQQLWRNGDATFSLGDTSRWSFTARGGLIYLLGYWDQAGASGVIVLDRRTGVLLKWFDERSVGFISGMAVGADGTIYVSNETGLFKLQ